MNTDWLHPLRKIEAKLDHLIVQMDALLAAARDDPAEVQAATDRLKVSAEALKAAVAASSDSKDPKEGE